MKVKTMKKRFGEQKNVKKWIISRWVLTEIQILYKPRAVNLLRDINYREVA